MNVSVDCPELDVLFADSSTELMLTGRSSISLRVEDAEGTGLQFRYAHGTTVVYLPMDSVRIT